jgi:hypothetical protein
MLLEANGEIVEIFFPGLEVIKTQPRKGYAWIANIKLVTSLLPVFIYHRALLFKCYIAS